jgi:hypothetical protein
MPAFLATQEVEIRRITVSNQSRQKVHETTCQPIKAECGGMPVILAIWNQKILIQAI